jgi:hypothetical protein
MSLNADTVVATTRVVLEVERRLGRRPQTIRSSSCAVLDHAEELERELSHPGD